MSPNTNTALPCWKILAVDDDSLYQKTTEFGLRNFQVLGRPIELLQAGSFGAASAILSRERDIAVVLLDVVMDTEDAGFRLVKAIRELLGNAAIRIVMVTGQPGQSSMQASLKDYDINDYWNKTELTAERLKAVITANVRSYDQLTTVQRARQGLQMIAESSSALGESRTAQEFASRMLVEIAGVLGVPPEGIVCAGASDGSDQEPVILAAAGSHSRLSGKSISNIEDPIIRQELSRCLSKKDSINAADHTVLYFDESLAGSAHAAYIATGRLPDQTETELLRVFTQNLGKGLHNVYLFSQLDRMAYEDSLVKLPNANALLRALSARGHDDRVLLLVDVDKFGEINLTLGTDVGDEVLLKLAQALRQAADPSVMVARISDDLFALLGSSQYIDPQAVEFTTANSAREAGLGPISVSTVLYELNDAAESGLQALAEARLALKQAKPSGLHQHSKFDPRLREQTQARFRLMQALVKALDNESLFIALQPQIDLQSGKVVGAEALARWIDTDGKFVSPGEFIPLAETTGLILRLGDQILRQTISAVKTLSNAGYKDLRIGFNTSMVQLTEPGFLERLERRIKEAGIKPGQLELEVTESVAMTRFDLIVELLQKVRSMGLAVAIDDFGTGFSSLAYLRRLPADRLKIDRAFVNEITGDNSGLSIAENIIELAQKLKLKTIAEGVETEAQGRWLRDHGCQEVQGFFYAKPMPLNELMDFLGR